MMDMFQSGCALTAVVPQDEIQPDQDQHATSQEPGCRDKHPVIIEQVSEPPKSTCSINALGDCRAGGHIQTLAGTVLECAVHHHQRRRACNRHGADESEAKAHRERSNNHYSLSLLHIEGLDGSARRILSRLERGELEKRPSDLARGGANRRIETICHAHTPGSAIVSIDANWGRVIPVLWTIESSRPTTSLPKPQFLGSHSPVANLALNPIPHNLCPKLQNRPPERRMILGCSNVAIT